MRHTLSMMTATAAFIFALTALPAAAETIKVTVKGMAFSPATINAKVGDVIEWKNEDAFPHTATAANKDFDLTMQKDQTVRFTVTKAGAIDYICRFHPSMRARVTVAE